MNLAVIGSGGREHAICYKLKQSPKIKKLICIPGNAGTQKIAENIKEDISNFEALYQTIKKKNIDIVVVGPEQPLVDGLVDYLNEKKVRVFGPDKFTSQLEGSKAFMKNLCKKNNIPTANFGIFNNFDNLYQIIKKQNIDIVVVGPEQPLVEGFVDYLNEKKVRVFGPDKFTSQLEGSKAFMKNLCKKNSCPFQDLQTFLEKFFYLAVTTFYLDQIL